MRVYSLTYTISESPIVRIAFHRTGTSGLYDMTKLLRRYKRPRKVTMTLQILVNVWRTFFGFCTVVPTPGSTGKRIELEISETSVLAGTISRLLDSYFINFHDRRTMRYFAGLKIALATNDTLRI